MTFDAFLRTVAGSAPSDWVRLAGATPGRLRFISRADVATTLEFGAAPRLDPRDQATWSKQIGRVPAFQLDCLLDGRVVFGDVLVLAARGDALLPLLHNDRSEVGTSRRDLARLAHGLTGQGGDFEAAWQAAGLKLAPNDPLA